MEVNYSAFFCVKKCYYVKDNQRYTSFCIVKDEVYLDIFTSKKFKEQDFFQIFYHQCDKKFLLYLKKIYSLNSKQGHLLIDELIEREMVYYPLSNVLRFFSVTEKELNQDKSSKKLIDRVSKKCFNFVKRYNKHASAYYKHISKFKSIKDVLCFYPQNFTSILPFWIKELKEGGESIIDAIDINEIELLNSFNIDAITLKNQYETIINKINSSAIKLRASLTVKLQKSIKILLIKHISFAKTILLAEHQIANELNDEDLRTELNIIENKLIHVEKELDLLVSTFEETTFLKKWWPPLLYPVPYSAVNSKISNLHQQENKLLEKIRLKQQVLQLIFNKLASC